MRLCSEAVRHRRHGPGRLRPAGRGGGPRRARPRAFRLRADRRRHLPAAAPLLDAVSRRCGDAPAARRAAGRGLPRRHGDPRRGTAGGMPRGVRASRPADEPSSSVERPARLRRGPGGAPADLRLPRSGGSPAAAPAARGRAGGGATAVAGERRSGDHCRLPRARTRAFRPRPGRNPPRRDLRRRRGRTVPRRQHRRRPCR